MCGIIGYIILDKSTPTKFPLFDNLHKSLYNLRNRGQDSIGICTVHGNEYKISKYAIDSHKENIYELLLANKNFHENNIHPTIAIGHTRFATHGEKTDINAHPFTSNDEQIILVHNGIIENYTELKQLLIKKEFKFISNTDSEVMVHLINFTKNLNPAKTNLEIVKIALSYLIGSWSFLIIFIDEPHKLYACKNKIPLLIGYTEDIIIISSETSGFNDLLKDYVEMEDNEILELDDDVNVEFKKRITKLF